MAPGVCVSSEKFLRHLMDSAGTKGAQKMSWRTPGKELRKPRIFCFFTLAETHNRYRKLPRFTAKVTESTPFLPNSKSALFGSFPTLQSRNILPLRWHGKEATDHVAGHAAGVMQQQFHTDLNNALFTSRPKARITGTESYRDFQERYRAYNFVS